MQVTYSVVIPCYNEELVLHETYRRISHVMEDMRDSYELVFVNDGSVDGTSEILDNLAYQDEKVRALHFSRNNGHQIAVSAGLDHAVGEAVIIIDADLQDPPDVIPEMAEKWRAGAQVVYGKRRSRKGESKFIEKTASWYYRFVRKMTDQDFPRDTGDFRLVDAQVVDVLRNMPEHSRYLRGMFSWAGFKQEAVLFDRDERFAGESHYSLKTMLKLAADGILSFSYKPLKLPLILGSLWLVLAFLTSLIMLIFTVAGHLFGLWWLVPLMMLLVSTIHFSLSISAAYLARIYEEAKGRPLYVIARRSGFPDEEASQPEN